MSGNIQEKIHNIGQKLRNIHRLSGKMEEKVRSIFGMIPAK
jgi:hypothetical protein